MTDRSTILERGLLAALKLAESTPWAELALADIAAEAELSLSEFHSVADKDELVDFAETYFDRAMSDEGGYREGTPRERLFDVIMLRFEAMEDYRAGLLSLMKYRDTSPTHLARLLVSRKRSADWALVCAGLDNDVDAPRAAKAVALAYIIARTAGAWRKEESVDFTGTMATLDRELREAGDRLERLHKLTGGFTKKRSQSEPHDPQAGEDIA